MAHTPHLLLLAHLCGSRPRAESADVDDGATLAQYLVRPLGNLVARLFAAALKERVGCAVQYAHYNGRVVAADAFASEYGV